MLAQVKTAKYWQALLVVVTLFALCLPHYYMIKKGRHCGHKPGCHDMGHPNPPNPTMEPGSAER
ncbi:MAG: hypothetical protein HY537_17005 [Deltaproteobacteria bacterium]|nr:hypothetical protein [Deltaproteobacteria bacterium]